MKSHDKNSLVFYIRQFLVSFFVELTHARIQLSIRNDVIPPLVAFYLFSFLISPHEILPCSWFSFETKNVIISLNLSDKHLTPTIHL
jgi:hypothetical protein